MRIRNKMVLGACLFLCAPLAGAQTVHVDDDADPNGDGASWATAYQYLQDALLAAVPGQEIHVAQGIYLPDRSENDPGIMVGDRTETFQLINGVALRGGYAGIGTPDPNARDIAGFKTTLGGDLIGDDDPNAPSSMTDNTFHIVTAGVVDPNCVLDGFTIRAANIDDANVATNPAGGAGAGMLIDGGSPTIQNCIFTANIAQVPLQVRAGAGGAVGIEDNSNPHFLDCVFVDNHAAVAGAVFARSAASATFTDCRFEDNTSDDTAGAIEHDEPPGGGALQFVGCTFTCNQAAIDGGAIRNRGHAMTLTLCTFADNTASQDGGALELVQGSDCTLVACSFSGNSAIGAFPLGGGAIHSEQASQLQVQQCWFLSNTAAGDGGAIRTESGSTATIINSVFSGNSSGQHGGALNLSDAVPDSTVSVIGCTLSGNSAGNLAGGAIHVAGAETLNLHNSILWGNAGLSTHTVYVSGGNVNVTYCDLEGITGPGAPIPGPTVISVDPMFLDPDGADDLIGTADDDLRLGFGSPCIDAGRNAAVPADSEDLDGDLNVDEPIPFDLAGNDRFVDDPATNDCAQDPNNNCGAPPVVDMGAYEFRGSVVLYVDTDAAGADDGTSWQGAYKHLQDALTDAAGSGGVVEQIWVAEGTYRPDETSLNPAGTDDRTETFQLQSGLAIYGGFEGFDSVVFPGGETELSQRDVAANETILSGDLNGDDAPGFVGNGENSYHVVTGSGTDPNAVLDGFTITAGNADEASGSEYGAGIVNTTGSPTVINCKVISNFAQYGAGMFNISGSDPLVSGCAFSENVSMVYGGGMSNQSSSPTVIGCTFACNSADDGAAIYDTSGSAMLVIDCTFSGNTSTRYGGGLCSIGSNPTMSGCAFVGNSAVVGGGVFNASSSYSLVTGCTFIGNVAAAQSPMESAYAGGVYNEGSDASVTNCLFTGNSAEYGGGLCNRSTGAAVITGCTFYGNTASGIYSENSSTAVSNCILRNDAPSAFGGPDTPAVTFSDIHGGFPGTGNIDADPFFVDPDGPDGIVGTLDDDLRLLPGSPCIDAGNNALVPADVLDLDGDGDANEPIPFDLVGAPRFLDDDDTPDCAQLTDPNDPNCSAPPVVDMGAYEFFKDCNGNGIPDQIEDPIDGIPDECQFWVATGGDWSIPGNWSMNQVPDNNMPNPGDRYYANILDPDADVTLDIDAEIDGLTMGPGAVLNLTNGGPGNLTIETAAGIRNDGEINIGLDHALIAGASFTLSGAGTVRLDHDPNDPNNPAIRSDPSSAVITNTSTIAGRGEISAGLVNSGVIRADDASGNLRLTGSSDMTNNGRLIGYEGGTLIVDRGVSGAGLFIAQGGDILVHEHITGDGIDVPFGSQGMVQINGVAASVDWATISGGVINVIGGGSLTVSGAVEVCPDPGEPNAIAELHILGSELFADDLTICDGGVLEVASTITLGGSLTLESADSGNWNWAADAQLIMTGGVGRTDVSFTGYPRLEVAGRDKGDPAADPNAFNNNFALEELVIGPGAHISLIDAFDNGNQGSNSTEVLYVRTLTFTDAAGRLDTHGLQLYVGQLNAPAGVAQLIDLKLTGDVNEDCAVNITDLGFVLGNFGKTGATLMDGDDNEDGVVNITDLGRVLGNFGAVCGG